MNNEFNFVKKDLQEIKIVEASRKFDIEKIKSIYRNKLRFFYFKINFHNIILNIQFNKY